MGEKINGMLKERDRLGNEIIIYMKENDVIENLDTKTKVLIDKMSSLLAYDDKVLEAMEERINMN